MDNSGKNPYLYHQGQIYILPEPEIPRTLMEHYHGTKASSHDRAEGTHRQIIDSFSWPGMKRAVQKFLRNCDVSQQNKYEDMKPARILQSLPNPKQVWRSALLGAHHCRRSSHLDGSRQTIHIQPISSP